MATRSTIALEFADGTVKQIYCQWDGYLAANGETLLNHYDTPEKVSELISMGDMSCLTDSIESSVFYGRDRNETGVSAERYDSFEDYCQNGDSQEYNYIMREGVWYVERGNQNEFITLVEAFKNEERL
jgi:hypothetical protein